jgi:hypothetical protein
VGLLAHDSISLDSRYFVLGSATVDNCKIKDEISSWEHRGALAAVKLKAYQHLVGNKDCWPALLASLQAYIEARIETPITYKAIDRIVVADDLWFRESSSLECRHEQERLKVIKILAEAEEIPIGPVSKYTAG